MTSSIEHLLLPVGATLANRYVVEGVLAVGGMSTVYAATDSVLARPVAVKVVSDDMVLEPGGATRFLREARAAAQLRTPRVPQVFDIGVLHEGNPYLVMERLEGRDLADVIAMTPRIPIEEAVDYVIQACDALAEVHARGIVHRDLKPANLFVTAAPDGAPFVKLVDFGVSKLMGKAPDVGLTQPGDTVGTPAYMAPERLERRWVPDPRADVWSLGAVLYELLTGAALFDGETIPDVVADLLTKPIPSVTSLQPDASPELDRVVARCLARDASLRFADVGLLAAALAPFGPKDSLARSEAISRSMERAREVPLDARTAASDADVLRLTPRAVSENAPTLGGAALEARSSDPRKFARASGRNPDRTRDRSRLVVAMLVTAVVSILGTLLGAMLAVHAAASSTQPPAASVTVTGARSVRATSEQEVAVDDNEEVGAGADVDPSDLHADEARSTSPSDSRGAPRLTHASASARVASVASRPRGARLVLDLVPATGTEIWSDGALLRIGAAHAVAIAPGVHQLKAVAAGRAVWAARINAVEGSVVHVRIPKAYAQPYDGL